MTSYYSVILDLKTFAATAKTVTVEPMLTNSFICSSRRYCDRCVCFPQKLGVGWVKSFAQELSNESSKFREGDVDVPVVVSSLAIVR